MPRGKTSPLKLAEVLPADLVEVTVFSKLYHDCSFFYRVGYLMLPT